MNSPRKIFIVDDHPLVRQGVRDFIEHEEDLTVCGEAANRQQALAGIEQTLPELLLVDLSLGKDSGLDLIKDVAARFPRVKMLVLSMQDELLYAERVLRAGASGYLGKDAGPALLVAAVRTVLDGGLFASEAVKQKMIRERIDKRGRPACNPVETLSDRELTVFEWIGAGRSTAEIAALMGLSVKTVETYRARIKAKLNLTSAAELVQQAVLFSPKT
jgi:DNA-binding NarL/FixJ family response regulator